MRQGHGGGRARPGGAALRASGLPAPHADTVLARPRVAPCPPRSRVHDLRVGLPDGFVLVTDIFDPAASEAHLRACSRARLGGAAFHHLWPHDADAAARGHVRTGRLPLLGHRASATAASAAARGDSPARRGRHGPRVQFSARESLSRWRDSVGWHRDSDYAHGGQPDIASVSSVRAAASSSVTGPARARLRTSHPEPAAHHARRRLAWWHRVPKTGRPVGPRVNLTFRHMVAEGR